MSETEDTGCWPAPPRAELEGALFAAIDAAGRRVELRLPGQSEQDIFMGDEGWPSGVSAAQELGADLDVPAHTIDVGSAWLVVPVPAAAATPSGVDFVPPPASFTRSWFVVDEQCTDDTGACPCGPVGLGEAVRCLSGPDLEAAVTAHIRAVSALASHAAAARSAANGVALAEEAIEMCVWCCLDPDAHAADLTDEAHARSGELAQVLARYPNRITFTTVLRRAKGRDV